MYRYVISGLAVTSDIALPGLIEQADTAAAPDVRIHAGIVPEALDEVRHDGPNWQIGPDRFLLTVPDIVRMTMRGGDEIVYALQGDTAPQDAAIFLSGTGFGILLHQRGRIVLHASAVRVGDRAVLFCGPSGAGKSTLAAALVAAGHDLVTDDVCGVDIDTDGVPWIHPDGRQLKLWQNSIDRLALAGSRAAPVRRQLEKFYVEPRTTVPGALPLGAVYVLREARPPIVPGIERPNIVDGALLVRNNAYRPAMVSRMLQQDSYFHAATAICAHAGVFTLARTMDFARLPETLGWLEAHWAAIGLGTRAA